MKIPRLSMNVRKLVHETEKAYLFLGLNDVEFWMPKSICHIEVVYKKRTVINIAPFKYSEIMNVTPQPLDSFTINEIENTKKDFEIPDYDIIEPKGISLYKIQIEKVIRVKRLRYFFVYGQMRTGKTIIAVTIAESRLNAGLINKIIVIAPLRVKKVWQTHFNVDFVFYPTEHFSNIHTREDIDLKADDKTLVILDESHQIKNKTIRANQIINAASTAGHKCILTGTPIGKHAGDLYNQFYFLNPRILDYSTYEAFEDAHLLYGGREGKKIVAYTNIEEISNKISPYTISMTRKEMDIDREKIYEVESYQISNRYEYDNLNKKFQDFFNKKRDDNILGYIVKLQQSANGYLFDEDDEIIDYIDNGRLSKLNEILERHKGKPIVIYFKYNQDLESLSKINVPILSGKTKQKYFNDIIEKFNNNEIKVIALQQQLSIGFSLRNAYIMIYYSRKFGSISSAQSEDRACESNTIPLKIIDIAAQDTIDEVIKKNINTSKNIINLIKKEL